MNREKSRRLVWLVGILLILVLGTVLIFNPNLRMALNANQGAISILLTATLVLLYFGQYQIQNQQLRFEHAAPIQIQRTETEGRYLKVWLSNPGNGPATNIELESCIEFPTVENFDSGCARKRLRRVDEEGDYKKRVGNALQAGEHYVCYQVDPVVGMQANGSNGGWGLNSATEILFSEDVEEVALDFRITNEDLLGNEYKEDVFGWKLIVPLEPGGLNIEEAKARSNPHEVRELIDEYS